MVIKKKQDGFILSDGNVPFEFASPVIPEKDVHGYTAEVIGEIPTPILFDTDRLILPIDEGVALKVGTKREDGEPDIGATWGSFTCKEGTVNMLAVEREGKFLLICLSDGADASYSAKNEGEGYMLSARCDTPHKITYAVCKTLPEACRKYREINGIKAKTLAEKFEALPEAKKLLGGIFWVFGDKYSEVMYADYDTDVSPLVGDDILKVAEELKKNGIDDAMFGIFFDGDSKYSKELYERYGYIATQYDNYDDVCPPRLLEIVPNNRVNNCGYTRRRLKDYPENIRIMKNGKPAPAWPLKGYDGEMHPQSKLCPKIALQRMKEEIPAIIAEYPYYKGRFIDVLGTAVVDCHSDEHPLTKKECIEIKKEAFNFLGEMGLIAGTEDGMEAVVDSLIYSEGMHSPACLRFKNSGRMHTEMFTEERTEYTKKYMLDPSCRVPLWHLIYHDCMLSFPYWGDATASSKEILRERILYSCLFGCPPIYAFSFKDFEAEKDDIIESYKRIYEIVSKIGMLKMTDWQVLSEDYMLQRSVFGERYEVVVNFSENDAEYNGNIIKARDFVFIVK